MLGAYDALQYDIFTEQLQMTRSQHNNKNRFSPLTSFACFAIMRLVYLDGG